MAIVYFTTSGTYVAYKGKKTVNFIHNHRNLFTKSSYKFGINSHQYHRILYFLTKSVRVQNYQLRIVSHVYDIRMGTSGSKS